MSATSNILIAYYHDREATSILPIDSLGNFKVDFTGVEPPRAGIDSVYITIFAKNIHHYPMELRPVTLDQDLKITVYPEYLEPQEVGKVVLAFSPSADRIRPLEGGSWDFEKVVLPNVK